MYFSSLGVFIPTVIPVYHSLSQISMSLSQQYIHIFSLCTDTQKRSRGKNWDNWIYFQFFIMLLLLFPAWTVGNPLWMTEVEAYSSFKKSEWKGTLNNMYFTSQDIWKICRTQRRNLQVSRNSNKETNFFPLSALVLCKHLQKVGVFS